MGNVYLLLGLPVRSFLMLSLLAYSIYLRYVSNSLICLIVMSICVLSPWSQNCFNRVTGDSWLMPCKLSSGRRELLLVGSKKDQEKCYYPIHRKEWKSSVSVGTQTNFAEFSILNDTCLSQKVKTNKQMIKQDQQWSVRKYSGSWNMRKEEYKELNA